LKVHLSLKKGLKKLITNPKGFSSVVGTVFMVLVMMILSTSVFLWTLSQNTLYNQALKERNQMELDRLNEKVTAYNVNYTVSGDVVTVEVLLKNEGAISIRITTLWVLDTTIKKYGFNNNLDLNLKPGENISLVNDKAISVELEGANATDTFNSWFVTTRGNAVPLEEEGGIILAQVAAGIGSVSMNYGAFLYYNVSKVGSEYVLDNYPNGSEGFTLPQTDIAFEVCLTNFDRNKREIKLFSSSVLWMLFPISPPQQPRGAKWYIVNVYNNGTIASTFTEVTLSYGVPTRVYFASYNDVNSGGFSPSSSGYSGPAAVNLMLVGKIGNSSYGQNIPFVSVYVE